MQIENFSGYTNNNDTRSKSDVPSTELLSMLTSLWFVDRRVPVENAGPICWEHSFLSIVLQNQPML